jgi:hypothetical protein
MKFWTAHLRRGDPPVLVREGFSWGALIFGVFWLLAHRAWIPAALVFAANLLIGSLTAGPVAWILMAALALWLGLSGNDLRRWSLQRRGFQVFQVLAARNQTEALARLLDRRPELAGSFLPSGFARPAAAAGATR